MNLPGRRSCVCVLSIGSMAIVLLSGCAGLTQPFPQKNLFAISVGDPSPAGAAPMKAVLRVQGVRVAKPYDELTFIYKTGDSAFTVDYYNGFIAGPDRLLTGELTRWLSESGLFATVVSGTSSVDYDLSLETSITGLYGDYSAKGSPKAVVEARFFLVNERGSSYDMLFQKAYRETEPVEGQKPEQLVKGWEKAFRRMLESLAADLRKVPPPTSRPAQAGQ
jgi:cholesterol transport system auxiliary component